MKRLSLYSLLFIVLVAGRVALGQSEPKPEGKKDCPFSIMGLWRSEITAQTQSIFFDFSPAGYVTLLGHSPDTLPQDFEMIDSVNYKLDKAATPKSIEFTTARGNDAFRQGITRLAITQYDDDSFTTRDPASGQQMQWVREQTHRYFLSFAAHPDPAQSGGPAFAMWTVMDGRKTDREALGVQLIKDPAGKAQPVFGPLPADFCDRIVEQCDQDAKRKKEAGSFLRVELSAAEFEITRQLYESWSRQVQTQTLPYSDAYLNGLEFLRRLAESLSPCGEKVKPLKLSQRERDELIAKHTLPQYTLEYIRALRKQNNDLHINDVVFPWQWRPMIHIPEQ